MLPILLLFFLCACSHEVVPQNTIVIGLETDIGSLDPRIASDAVSANVCRLLYAGLMRRDEKMALKPWLASSVNRIDATTYEIKIKTNATFHDGRPLTSADVRWTINSILDEKFGSPLRNGLGEILSVDAPDPFTIIVKLKEPFAPFVGNLTFGIVPDGSGGLSEHPVGSGPFRFSYRHRGADLALVRNDTYFDKPALLSGVKFKIVPEETVRLLELSKGNLHMVTSPIMPAMLPWLEGRKNIRLEKIQGTNVSYIGFNLQDQRLKNLRVRRAIAHAVDRDAIIRHFLKDTATKTTTLVAPANEFHLEEIPLGYDPAKSKQLLDEAGYRDPGNGGTRFNLVFKTSKNPERRKIAEIISQYLRNVGIGLEIKSYEWGTFFADVRSGNFQLYSLTWVGMADPDALRFIFRSNYAPPKGFNRGRYENAELDKLLDDGKTEADPARRKKIYRQVQRTLSEELPFINLWTQVNVAALDKRVRGFVIYPDESFDSLVTTEIKNGAE